MWIGRPACCEIVHWEMFDEQVICRKHIIHLQMFADQLARSGPFYPAFRHLSAALLHLHPPSYDSRLMNISLSCFASRVNRVRPTPSALLSVDEPLSVPEIRSLLAEQYSEFKQLQRMASTASIDSPVLGPSYTETH